MDAGQHNGLVATDPARLVGWVRVASSILGVGFSADDEETPRHVQGEESLEVHVATVHDVESSRLGQQNIEDVDIVQLAVGDMDEGGDVASQIQQGMELDGRLGGAKVRPRKDRQAQVDGGGVESVDRIVEIKSQFLVGMEGTGDTDQGLGEIGVDAPVAVFVGFGQSIASHALGTQTHVIQLALMCTQTDFDPAQTLAVGQLGEGHDQVLVEAAKPLHITLALIAGNTPAEAMHGKVIHDLGKNEFACVHESSPF